jgi:hypothetical protein
MVEISVAQKTGFFVWLKFQWLKKPGFLHDSKKITVQTDFVATAAPNRCNKVITNYDFKTYVRQPIFSFFFNSFVRTSLWTTMTVVLYAT